MPRPDLGGPVAAGALNSRATSRLPLRARRRAFLESSVSGHSKWASIKHKKAATDAKRGQLFTKLARAIAIAAREGGGDPDSNFTLAAAIEKAKGYSMPKDNIERAIDRGTGEGSGDEQIERVVYEGYGPGGAALLVEALTDNRNRTGSEVRHAFDSHSGNLGEPGSVAWQFEKKGVIVVDGERYSEDDLLGAIDAGAEDVAPDGDVLKVTRRRPSSPTCGRRSRPTGSRSSRRSSRWSRTRWWRSPTRARRERWCG